MQSGRVIHDMSVFGSILLSIATERIDLGKDFLDKEVDKFNKKCITGEGWGITLTNNEIKDIIKVIKSLENRKIY